MEFTPARTISFAAIVCFVCSIFVASAAVGLKEKQKENEILDRQKKVLDVAGLLSADIANSADLIKKAYSDRVKPVLVDLKAEGCKGQDANTFDQQKFAKDPATSTDVSGNKAKVQRTPNCAKIFEIKGAGGQGVETVILPVEGKGLWSTLYGFVALNPNGVDIKGLTFYKHAETPGLGGEVDNPKWKAQWKGKKAFKVGSEVPALYVKKGKSNDNYSVDGLSGATLTSNGVTHLLQFWLGEQGFGAYLKNLKGGK
jgi:Na+-transporting NADH:ubiquinone oxidoreductase subunit C